MTLAALMMAALLLGAGAGTSRDASRLSQLVGEIRAADYRGERAQLRKLASALEAVKAPELVAYRDYWRGFALWRRAMNGFNETPLPADLRDDLREAVRSFRGSLGHRPGWVEAEVGKVGCWSNLLFLARSAACASGHLPPTVAIPRGRCRPTKRVSRLHAGKRCRRTRLRAGSRPGGVRRSS